MFLLLGLFLLANLFLPRLYGGNDEWEQTPNQLLTEMDGFAVGDRIVVVLAATNCLESLDLALLRLGRFARQVLVDPPDLSGRKAILLISSSGAAKGECKIYHTATAALKAALEWIAW